MYNVFIGHVVTKLYDRNFLRFELLVGYLARRLANLGNVFFRWRDHLLLDETNLSKLIKELPDYSHRLVCRSERKDKK